MVAIMRFNKDMVLLKKMRTVEKHFGAYSQDKTKSIVYSVTILTIYLFSLMCNCGAIWITCRNCRWTSIFLLTFLTIFTSMFHVTNFTGSFRHKENWKKLVRNFSEIDVTIMFTFDGDIRISCLKIWIFNSASYLMVLAWLFLYYQRLEDIALPYACNTIFYIFTLVMSQWLVVTMNQISSMMLARYRCIEQMIRTVVLQHEFFLVKNRLKVIQKVVCMMNDCITLMNGIFGGPMIFLMVFTFVHILVIFDFTLNISTNSEIFMAIGYIQECLSTTIFTIHIVHNCDKIEKAYERLLTTTNVLQMQIDDEAKRDALLALFEYMKKMRPTISAAGFFQVNQSLFSSFLTTLVSYSIIVVQLQTSNMS